MIKKNTKVLIFGAGRSSVYFIKQLSEYFASNEKSITIIDQNFQHLENLDYCTTAVVLKQMEISEAVFDEYISTHDIIVSLLPAAFHVGIAKYCLKFNKHLLTASYVDEAMQALDKEAKQKGLIFLNEMGLDPGLDHISAMSLMDEIKQNGGQITSYASHTGGLTLPSTNPSDWNYKFTWNPKNVILAGKDGAQFSKNGELQNIPYSEIFKSSTSVQIAQNTYDSYPNRNSLNYKTKYDLVDTDSVYRGTLRHQGFCEAWQIFVALGMTDDRNILEFTTTSTQQDFLNHFLPQKTELNTSKRFSDYFKINIEHPIYKKFEGLDFFNSNKTLCLQKGTAADILLAILSQYWQLPEGLLDLVVMKHEIAYEKKGQKFRAESILEIKGENSVITAMSKTVGAPLFEGFKLIHENRITAKGVLIPTKQEIYKNVLKSLENHGIVFEDTLEIRVCDRD